MQISVQKAFELAKRRLAEINASTYGHLYSDHIAVCQKFLRRAAVLDRASYVEVTDQDLEALVQFPEKQSS